MNFVLFDHFLQYNFSSVREPGGLGGEPPKLCLPFQECSAAVVMNQMSKYVIMLMQQNKSETHFALPFCKVTHIFWQ